MNFKLQNYATTVTKNWNISRWKEMQECKGKSESKIAQKAIHTYLTRAYNFAINITNLACLWIESQKNHMQLSRST